MLVLFNSQAFFERSSFQPFFRKLSSRTRNTHPILVDGIKRTGSVALSGPYGLCCKQVIRLLL